MTRLGLQRGHGHQAGTLQDSTQPGEASKASVSSQGSEALRLPDAPTSPPKLAPTPNKARATTATRAHFAAGLFRRFANPIAAVMLGAATLPAMSGAALAQTAPADHEVRIEAPATLHAAGHLVSPSSRPAGPLDPGRLFERHLQTRLVDLAAQRAQFEAQAPADPIIRTDLLRLDKVVQNVDRLIRQEGTLPTNLLADLDHLLKGLQDAEPGHFAKTIDLHLKDLPSDSFEVPQVGRSAIDVRAPTLEAAPQVQGPGHGWLKDLLAASPTDFPDKAQAALQQYSAVMTGVDAAFAQLPDFEMLSPAPLAVNSGEGVLLVPPGARIIKDDGQFAIEAPGMLFAQDGLTVVASDAAIRLGSDLDGLQAGRVVAAGDDWTAGLEGVETGVHRDRGYGVIRAERADLDLSGQALHLENAQLVVGASGDSRLQADALSMLGEDYALDLTQVDVQQSREGSSATAASAHFAAGGTVLQGETLDLRFGPTGAHIEARALDVVSGDTRLNLQDAVIDMRPRADGGHDLAFSGQSIGLSDKHSALQLGAGTQGSLRLGPDGVLQQASFSAGQVDLTTPDGTAHLENASVQAQVGDSGYLSALTVRGDELGFTGDGFALDASDGRLDLNFGADGHLSRIATRASAAALTTDEGAFSVTDGVLDARFEQGSLRTAAAELGTAQWRGTDGTTVDAANSRARLAFADDGALSQVALAAGAVNVGLSDGRQVSVSEGKGRLNLGPDGVLSSAQLSTGRLVVNDAEQKLDLSGLQVRAQFDDAGLLQQASANAARLQYTHAEGTVLSTGAVQLDATLQDGVLSQLDVAADDIRYTGSLGDISATSGSLQTTFTADGQPQALRFDTEDLVASGDYGRLAIQGAGQIDAQWSPDGTQLSRVAAHADQLDFVDEGRTLSITEGDLAITMNGDAVSSATASFEQAHYAGDFGDLALTGGTDLSIDYDEQGAATVRGFAQHLDLAHEGGRLNLEGGHVQGHINSDGVTERLQLGAQQLSYSGIADGEHPLTVDLSNPNAVLTALDNGGQQLDVSTGSGAFSVDGHSVSLDGVQQLSLQTNAKGQVDGFTADFDGQIEFLQQGGDLGIRARDVQAGYEREASRLTLDFGQLDVALKSEGLQAKIEGGHALLDEHQLFVQVDRAEVLRDLGAQLDVEVEDLTLRIARGEQGSLQELVLSLGGLDATIDELQMMVRTPAGERVRLNVRTDDEGRLIKDAFLQIPEGGEVRVQREDLDLSLGGQRLSFSHGDDGLYRFRGESLDIAASTKDATVRVEGGNAEVSMDPATGRLVIEEITGTHIDLSTADADLHVDIEALQGFMLKMTGLEGGATGAALHLEPTGDGSTLTARATADIGGIPVEVSFSDVHELEALGQISENQVHVFARDPSGRGDIKIGVGPVQLQGSAIELVGRYHPYDAGRMTESVHQFVTTGGAKLFSGVQFEPDGVLRLGTDRDGANAELAILLPRQHSLPGYRFALTPQPSAAPGVVGSLGYRFDDVTLSMFAGVMPGSHATLHVKEGDVSLGGVPVPERTDLPTTGVAGLRLDLADVNGGHLGLVGGGYVNPAGLVDSPFVTEDAPFGAMAGVEYTKDSWSLSAGGVLDFNNDGQVQGGAVTLRVGISF